MEVSTEKFPWWKKQLLTLNEASEYYGIGYKTLARFLKDHPDAGLTVENGTHTLVKRKKFQKYIAEEMTVL